MGVRAYEPPNVVIAKPVCALARNDNIFTFTGWVDVGIDPYNGLLMGVWLYGGGTHWSRPTGCLSVVLLLAPPLGELAAKLTERGRQQLVIPLYIAFLAEVVFM